MVREELMIGNHVKYQNRHYAVIAIEEDGIIAKSLNDDKREVYLKYRQVQPRLLNSAYLNDVCGKKSGQAHFYEYVRNNSLFTFEVKKLKEGYSVGLRYVVKEAKIDTHTHICVINNVSELQNLIYAITKERI